MYDKISNLTVDFYDYDTGQFSGKARFMLTAEVEKALLQLVNHGVMPASMLLRYVEVYQMPESYTPPEPYQKHRRRAVLTATFIDSQANSQMPVAIKCAHDVMIRSLLYDSIYQSVEISGIRVEGISPMVT